MMRIGNDGYHQIYVALEVEASATRATYYLHGDFNAGYNAPTRKDLLKFASALPELVAQLEEHANQPEVDL